MRIIKFRAWDKNKREMKKFTFEDIYNNGQNPFIKVRGNYCIYLNWEIIKVMQFTGLKDKNGKEIYEGDIIKFPSGVVEVKWLIGMYNICPLVDDDTISLKTIIKEHKKCEVIGNIYENPELMEEKER